MHACMSTYFRTNVCMNELGGYSNSSSNNYNAESIYINYSSNTNNIKTTLYTQWILGIIKQNIGCYSKSREVSGSPGES